MVSKATLVILRSQLPAGAGEKIRQRLEKKGHILTIQWINRVLNPDDVEAKSELVIEEAILLRDEYQNHIAEMEQRILHP